MRKLLSIFLISLITISSMVVLAYTHAQVTTINGNALGTAVTGNYTVPCGVTSITVQIWGGGGGGYGDDSDDGVTGRGGGAGGYSTRVITVTSGQIIPYSVGWGGFAGSPAGANGGPTSILGLTANGGVGGNVASGGTGGSATGGTTNTAGGSSANTGSATNGAAGGSAAGGGGAGGAGGGNGANGTAGAAPGGGGGASGDRSGGSENGGAGGPGRIVITPGAAASVTANAGADQTPAACVGAVTLAGNNPSPLTGTWTCTANCVGVVIDNPSQYNSVVYIPPGTDPTLNWKIDGCASNDNVVINTTTGANCPTVCAGGANDCATANMYISKVTFGTMQNASGCQNGGGSGECVTVIQGQTLDLTIATGPYNNGYQMSLGVYFDWNADGDFADAGEFTLMQSDALAGTTYTIPVTVPAALGSACGKTIKFRTRLSYNTVIDQADACDDASLYGETEDYCITLTCPAPTCTDGVMNGTEIGIDCGGSCPACTNDCDNGIQDGAETGVDCGATCVPCTTNNTPIDGGPGCSPAVQATVLTTNCDQIGTSAFELNTPTGIFQPVVDGTLPTVSPTCGGGATLQGEWIHVDLAAGITTLQAALDEDYASTIPNGNLDVYAAVYQSSCGTANYIGCQQVINVIMGNAYFFNAIWTGLNPNLDAWIYVYGSAAFNLGIEFTGSAGAPSNESCSSPSTGATGCNLGAVGDGFTTPGAAGQPCDGSYNWGSNENTVYHTFTASDTDGSLAVGNIYCNDGGSGVAQFGVFRNCACVGTYSAACYFGCATGNGEMTLTALVPGNTYIIAVDGFAGDQCTWDFIAEGIILPVDLITLRATRHNGKNVVYWKTASERNCRNFVIERSLDGENWEDVGSIDGHGTTTESYEYYFHDEDRIDASLVYYRLRQYDYDGEYEYQGPVALNIEASFGETAVIPNPVSNKAEIRFNAIKTSKHDISVIDMTGREVIKLEHDAIYGKNAVEIDTEDLKGGYYFVVINDYSNQPIKTKFVKN